MDIYKFYNTVGWKKNKKISYDAELFEDLRDVSKEYVAKCRIRLYKFIPPNGVHMLDFASGPLQYKEYLNYSKNFKLRHCVDFSSDAIKNAKKKLKNKGKYYCNDFLKINFRENYFDCIISMHTIYHIKKMNQKKVVKKLLKISKPNAPIIIVYSNPDTFVSRIKKIFKYKSKSKGKLYFYCFNNSWWKQFTPLADVRIYPWRSFSSGHQKFLFPDNKLGKIMFHVLFNLENIFNKFFVNNFQYQMIILKKKAS